MSTSYYAYAVMGVRLAKKDLFTTKSVKTFDHNYPSDWTVDPKTGKKLWRDCDVCIFGGEEGFEEKVDYFDFIRDDDHNFYYLGIAARTEPWKKHETMIKVPNEAFITALKDGLSALLSPHNLWDEKDFGVWPVLWVC